MLIIELICTHLFITALISHELEGTTVTADFRCDIPTGWVSAVWLGFLDAGAGLVDYQAGISCGFDSYSGSKDGNLSQQALSLWMYTGQSLAKARYCPRQFAHIDGSSDLQETREGLRNENISKVQYSYGRSDPTTSVYGAGIRGSCFFVSPNRSRILGPQGPLGSTWWLSMMIQWRP